MQSRKKVLILALIVILVATAVFVLWKLVFNQNESQEVSPPSGLQPVTQEQIEKARQVQYAEGVLNAVTGDELRITTKDGQALTLTITENTIYETGPEYFKGDRQELAVGQEVKFSYNNSDMTMESLWYPKN